MPPGLICLHASKTADAGSRPLVDIIAVHGLGDDSLEAWTDPETGTNWLRDFLPQHIPEARVLTYGYDASPSLWLTSGAASNIEKTAESFVQELYADRKFAGACRRPIIFICHGLGGILVKKSLAFSSTRVAAKVDHLWDQFVSTFAILFFGTPHGRSSKSNWLALDKTLRSGKRSGLLSLERFSRPSGNDELSFRSVCGDFAPIMKQFHMFFFWEELPTTFGDREAYIVDPAAAVLDLDNTEKAGIHANHTDMIRFASTQLSSYRTVIEAMSRYYYDAPRTISKRWMQAIPKLNQLRVEEALELGGGIVFDIHSQNPFQHRDIRPHHTTNCHFYPPQEASPDFVGRKDMLQVMQDAFFPCGTPCHSKKRKSFVIHGLGGSGKTQLSSKYAEDFQDNYTAIFTIHATSPETIKESFCMIAQLGGLEATENAGRHFLAQLSEVWLLIIDNADDPSRKLQDIYPFGHMAHIIVTTRNPDFRKEGTLGSLEMSGLRECEALQLLLRKADIPEPWDYHTIEAATKITKALGYLALALIHAGNCIFRRICGLEDYLILHSASRTHLQRRKPMGEKQEGVGDILGNLYSTFDISMECLLRTRTVKSEDATELLKIVSFYHFERIPIEIFTRAVVNRRDANKETAGRVVSARVTDGIVRRLEPPKMLPRFLRGDVEQLDKYRVNSAISDLQSFSLLSYDGKDQTFSLHPLVHAWARDNLSVSERSVWATIAFNTLMESIVLPRANDVEAVGEFHRHILPHLDVCIKEYGNPVSYSVRGWSRWKIQITKFTQPTWIMIVRDQVLHAAKCGFLLASCGQFENAAMHLQIVKDTLVQLLGVRHEKSMVAMLGLAAVLWGLGRLEEAISLQSTVVEARSKLYGDHDEKTLEATNHLGRSYWLYGQYREALALQEEAVRRARASLGSTHRLTLTILDNLGVTLRSWLRWDESMQAHREVLAGRRELLGDTHLDTLDTMCNLAMALLDLDQVHEARILMSKVYQLRQELLGKEHPWTLWALWYLAKIYIQSKLLTEAEQLLLWGIGAAERSLSKTHLGVLCARGELSRVYIRQGRRKEGLVLLLDTIRLLEANRGIAHPDCIYGLWKLARVYCLEDNTAKAIETCTIAIERADIRLGREHPITLKIENMLKELRDGAGGRGKPNDSAA